MLNRSIKAAILITSVANIPIIMADEQPEKTKSSFFKESTQAKSQGVIKDSKLNILIRNFYINRDFRNSSHNSYGAKKAQSYQEEWGQGFIGSYQSGFTQGTIGFGVDAIGMYGFRLDSGKGRAGGQLFPRNSNKKPEKDFSRAGIAAKARLSNTIVKYGEQMVATPVFDTNDGRLLPETATGLLIESNEIDKLQLTFGRFTALSARNQSGQDTQVNSILGYKQHNGKGLKSINLAGANYQFTNNLSASAYFSDVKDFWKKQYLGADYVLPLTNDQELNFNFDYYHVKAQGDMKRVYKIDSNTWSLTGAYTIDAHTFLIGYQSSSGKGGMPYGIEGKDAVYLGNSSQVSDYNNEGEKSWQASYTIKLDKFGLPGLSIINRYVRGDNIANSWTKLKSGKGKEWEYNLDARYVVQSGPAKDLSFRVRHATYRSSALDDRNEVRLIVQYPLNIL